MKMTTRCGLRKVECFLGVASVCGTARGVAVMALLTLGVLWSPPACAAAVEVIPFYDWPPTAGSPVSDVQSFRVSPDGSTAVFVADLEANEVLALYAVAVNGSSSAVKLYDPIRNTDYVPFDFAITPDGRRVVFADNWSGDEDKELFSVPTDGGTEPLSLHRIEADLHFGPDSPLLHSDRNSYQMAQFTPDGMRLVYCFDTSYGAAGYAYAAEIDGSSAPLLLSDQLPCDYGFTDTHILSMSSDGKWVVIAPRGWFSNPDYGILTMPMDGHSPALNLSAQGEYCTDSISISPDGKTVLFRMFAEYESAYYIAPIDGTTLPHKVETVPPILKSSCPYAPEAIWTPDSKRLVYYGKEGDAEGIYSVPVDGSAPATKVCGPMDLPETFDLRPWSFSSDGATLVFRDAEGTLYSGPIAGTGVPTQVSGESGARDGAYEITTDDSRVIYWRSVLASELQQLQTAGEIYSAPLDGGSPPVDLGPIHIQRTRTHGMQDFVLSEDRVVYASLNPESGAVELRSAPVSGNAPPVVLNGPLCTGGDVVEFGITPGNPYIAYLADQDEDETFELYSVPVSGGTPVKISGSSLRLYPHVLPDQYAATPDSKNIVFLYGEDQTGPLFSVPSDASAPPVELSDDGLVSDFALSPDSQSVAFESDGVSYLTSVNGSDAPTSVGRAGRILRFGSDSQTVLFQGEREVWVPDPPPDPPTFPDKSYYYTEVYVSAFTVGGVLDELFVDFSYAIDPTGKWLIVGTYPGLTVHGVDGESRAVPVGISDYHPLTVSPDGQWIIFRDIWSGLLYSIHPDGVSQPIALTGDLGYVESVQVSSDNQWVMFRTVKYGQYAERLFSVPVDGSKPPVLFASRLEDTEPAFSELLTPDGRRVVYRSGDALYSARTDGGASAVLLSGSEHVKDFRVTPDSQRAVYLADTGEADELFNVGLNGLTVPIKLNAPLSQGAKVAALKGFPFCISPTGNSVSFSVFQRTDGEQGTYGLFSVATSGGEAIKRSSDVTQTDGAGIWLGPNLVYADICVSPETGGLYLSKMSTFVLLPGEDAAFSGPIGGPFSPEYFEYTLANEGVEPLDYSVSVDGQGVVLKRSTDPVASAQITGTLEGGVSMNVYVLPDAEYAATLERGEYEYTILFADSTTATPTATRIAKLSITGITVPDCTSLAQEEAETLIEEVGLVIGRVIEESSATIPAGQVITQDPVPGAVVPDATSVQLTISKGSGTGGLQVEIQPEEACTDGARWRIDGGAWQESGKSTLTLAVGTHLVEFKEIEVAQYFGCYRSIAKWGTPESQTVVIEADETMKVTGTYVWSEKALGAAIGSPGDLVVLAASVGIFFVLKQKVCPK